MQNVKQTLQTAISLHQGGRLGEAERLYRQVLAVDATQPDALRLLGLLAHQLGKHEQAVELMQASLRRAPNNSGATTTWAKRCGRWGGWRKPRWRIGRRWG